MAQALTNNAMEIIDCNDFITNPQHAVYAPIVRALGPIVRQTLRIVRTIVKQAQLSYAMQVLALFVVF
jgi:hypothetical protein